MLFMKLNNKKIVIKLLYLGSWADSGNRTRIFSLAKRNFTIRPYPHFFVLDTQYVPTYMIYNRILFVQCRDTYSLRNDSNYFFNYILFIQEV